MEVAVIKVVEVAVVKVVEVAACCAKLGRATGSGPSHPDN